jgi:hypothetical protein
MRKNLLDFVVVREDRPEWRTTEAGLTQIIIPRDGLMDRFVRLLRRSTPRSFTVDLDEFGSFVWEAIDDRRTVFEIGILLKERFGAKVEPVYERLALFLRILKNNRLIRYVTPD